MSEMILKSSAKQFGQMLNVDLNSGHCLLSKFPDSGKAFLGGRGFNIWYLYHHLPDKTEPLSPENMMLLSCGFLTGSSAPASARLHINSLSPLTGILGSSNIGGYAGAWLRSCDIASIVITGRSQTPVYLYIDSHGPCLKDASKLWGKDAFETQDLIKAFHGSKKLKILTIGPGGENKVRFAAIMSGKDHAAGRTGMGAVMGSKNIKAIVIAKGGHKHFSAVTPVQKSAVKAYADLIRKSTEYDTFSKTGGAGYLEWVNDFGIMGSRNYSEIGVDNVESIDGKALVKNIVRSSGCFRCPVQCKADLKFQGLDSEECYTRPEFEPMINLGPKCGLGDIKKIIELDNLCNRLGLDSTSAATTIAFVMELNEKKLLPEKYTGLLDLSWGNAHTMKKLLFQMVDAKGLGRILRLGVREAAAAFGKRSSRYAAHVKGLELTAYHPCAIMGTALGYAVSSRGGDYNNVYASLEYSMSEKESEQEFGTKDAVNIKMISAKGQLIKKAVITNILVDCLGLCKVPVLSLLRSFNLEYEIKLINGLCGLNLTKEQLFCAGEKIVNIEKWFNIKHAVQDIEDNLPEMFFTSEKRPELSRKDFKTMLQEYYAVMGWDKNGIPADPI